MSEKHYRNVETEEVFTLEDGAEDIYKDVIIDGTTNPLYREISAVEAGVAPAEEEVPVPEVAEEPVVQE